MKIVLIGSGNVATHLGPALKKSGHSILQVFGRTAPHVSLLAKKLKCDYATNPELLNPKADFYLIALRDEVIPDVLPYISNKKALVAHTSGSVSVNVFPREFEHAGVAYPLQTFSLTRQLKVNDIPFCLEVRSPATKNKLLRAIRSLSTHLHWLNSDQRKILHLSAVFANNFSNHMFVIAEELLKKNNLSFDILRPLIQETATKIRNHPPSAMQTGPARRGDSETIEKHLNLLLQYPEYASIYSLITKSIEKHSGPLL
ncbi:MAG TPA: DUF2520 domain-containing protein [Bacteroidia bacterium]|nr:DUF2520 domain-containing protein [Bacteroidia bacterium]